MGDIVHWKVFNPTVEAFVSKKDYEEYRGNARCAICRNRLEIGDEFDIRPVQTPEEAGSLSVIAVVVHRKCVEEPK